MARNEAAVAFGREVRRRRHTQGLTLDALGEAAGLTPHYVGSIEAGQRSRRAGSVQASMRSLISGLSGRFRRAKTRLRAEREASRRPARRPAASPRSKPTVSPCVNPAASPCLRPCVNPADFPRSYPAASPCSRQLPDAPIPAKYSGAGVAGIARNDVEITDFGLAVRHLDRLFGGLLLATSPRLDWATLLRQTYAVDVLTCVRCGSAIAPDLCDYGESHGEENP